MTDKAVKVGFGFFAATSLFFGAVSIRQKIQIAGVDPQQGSSESSAAAFEEARLRVLDTDEDGLTDWEELNAYKTSPYLADSDSDGDSDASEVGGGTDPNCPKGRVCGSDIIQTLEALQDQAAGEEPAEDAASGSADDFSDASKQALDALEAGTIPTVEQIRALLKDSGISGEELEGTSDEDLVKLFQEVAAEQAQ